MLAKLETVIAWVVAVLLLQTLYFKFTGAAESRWIFSQLGVEPWGRFFTGALELIAAALLLSPKQRAWGSLLVCGLMGGAVLSHVLVLGISVANDGGLLFAMACGCLLGGLFLLSRHFRELPFLRGLALVVLLPMASFAKISYNDEAKFAVQGYDTVAYLEQTKAVEGKKEFSYKYDGLTYLFASQAHKDRFVASPTKYVPAYGGWCAYAMAEGEKVDIDPETFRIIDGKTYLFFNQWPWGNTLEKWKPKEAELKARADAHWQKLIK